MPQLARQFKPQPSPLSILGLGTTSEKQDGRLHNAMKL
jgi:hypothetical protein